MAVFSTYLRTAGVITSVSDELPPSAHAVDVIAAAHGLAAEAFRKRLTSLRANHCPCLMELADGKWLCIAEMGAQGLAVCIDQAGLRQFIALAGLPAARGSWCLRPLVEAEAPAAQPFHLRSLWRSLLPSRRVILPVVLATIAINFLALAIPLATMNILDRVISNAAFSTLYAIAIGVCISIAFDFVLRGLRSLLIDRASARDEVVFSNALFARVLGAKSSARVLPVGIQANTMREIEQVRDYVNSTAIAALGDLPFLILFLAVIWLVAGDVVAVPLLAIPVVIITMLLLQWRLRRVVQASFNDSASKNALAVEVLSGIDTIKNAAAEEWALRQWERSVASQLRHSLMNRRLANLAGNLVTVFQGLTTIALLVYGVHLVTKGEITPGALFAANMLAGRCMGPLGVFAALLSRLQQNRMAISSVRELVGMEQERGEGRQLLCPPPLSNRITLEGVSFAFGKDAPAALSSVSLAITKGERVGVIGAIGSGKSTLGRLLTAHELPQQGQVFFDGISTQHIDPVHLRSSMGILPQSPAFFRANLRDNVLLGRKNISDIDVMQALTRAGAQGWVARQAKGLDTMLGEGGQGLSLGQRQTVALARALVGQPQLIVMDEPTSHLDQQTEIQIQRMLRAMPGGTTLILVTHSPLMLEAVDRLIVVEKGKILLDGQKADVMARLRNVVEQRKAAVPASQSAPVVAVPPAQPEVA
jgi:ATP-binding cassette subfamily C protein LapB